MSQNYIPQLVFRGKPYITVSPRGISNGLSDTLNDGADFGPDTLLNATSPNQYGPPYTQTVGIQEAMNYSATSPLFASDPGHLFYPIRLLAGNFEFSTPVTYGIGNYSPSDVFTIDISGSGIQSTVITYTGTGNAITIHPSIGEVALRGFTINNPNATANTMIYWDTTVTFNQLVVKDINNGQGTSSYLMYFNNVFNATIKDVVSPAFYGIYINGNSNNSGFLYMHNQIWGGGIQTEIGQFVFADKIGRAHV